jgi:hypothetical protein
MKFDLTEQEFIHLQSILLHATLLPCPLAVTYPLLTKLQEQAQANQGKSYDDGRIDAQRGAATRGAGTARTDPRAVPSITTGGTDPAAAGKPAGS